MRPPRTGFPPQAHQARSARRNTTARAWSHPALVAGGIFLVALLWRLGYLARLDASVLARSLVSDSEIYWFWAGFLREHGWLGQNPFYMGPLYPYSLAFLRSILGDSVPAILLVQAIFGAASCALLGDTVRRVSGPGLGLVVGLWAAFYESAVFMDGLVLMESQLFVLEALLLWMIALRPPAERRLATVFAIGLLLGLLAAGRASSLLLVPVTLAFFVHPAGGPAPRAGGGGRRLWGRAAALLAGVLVVAAPIALRNRALGREWIPFTYNGGLNLYIGNSPQANGTFIVVTGTQVVATGSRPEGVGIDGREYIRLTTGRDLTPAESSGWWTDRALEWMRAHPGAALELAARRLAMMWNHVEYPQVESLDEFREVAGPLGIPWAGSFAVLGPFALVGLYVVAGRRRGGWVGAYAAAYAGAMTLAILPFFVTDRYRHHLVPAALVLAGIGLAELVAAARRREAPTLRALALAFVAALVVVNLPVPRLSDAKREWGLAADLGARSLEKNQPAAALRAFERALAIERAGRLPAVTTGAGDTHALERASLYTNYALALEQAGRADEAHGWLVRARALAPDNAQVLTALAANEMRRGNLGAADSLYKSMRGAVQGGNAGEFGQGMIAARQGRLAEAAAHFTAATRLDPTNHAAWGALVRLELQAGRAAAAESLLDVASRAGWGDDAALLHRALARAAQRDLDGARQLRARVPAAAIAADPVLRDIDTMLDRMLELH
ncbi:MAG: tetratricopeptide repeat protein [Candidatus Eisenbacteria bacterium]